MKTIPKLDASLFEFTDEEFLLFCEANRPIRIERDKYQNIIFMPPTGYKTSYYNNKIAFRLTYWNEENGLGIVLESNGGVKLPNGAIRSAEVAWVSNERHLQLADNEQNGFASVCPDFVIELKSPSDSLENLKQKMAEWIENGCRLAWLINPEERLVYIYYEDGSVLEMGFHEKLSGEEVLKGFEIELNAIFI
jgi:Uma2 family endonuclease